MLSSIRLLLNPLTKQLHNIKSILKHFVWERVIYIETNLSKKDVSDKVISVLISNNIDSMELKIKSLPFWGCFYAIPNFVLFDFACT